MDQVLVDRLCSLPPQAWAEAIARHQAVDEYLAARGASVQTIQNLAGKLGIDQRTFYRMIEERRNPRERRRRGPARTRPEIESIMSQAICLVGRPCQIKEVRDEVVRLCEARGLRPPSDDLIRLRFREARGLSAFVDGTFAADYVIDACELDFDVVEQGVREPAILAAVLSPSTGSISSHRLFCGAPTKAEIGSLITDVGVTSGAGRDKHISIIAAGALRGCLDDLESLLGGHNLIAPYAPPRARGAARLTRAGEAIAQSLGCKIGPIRLRAIKNRMRAPTAVVDLAVAARVVETLLKPLQEGSLG